MCHIFIIVVNVLEIRGKICFLIIKKGCSLAKGCFVITGSVKWNILVKIILYLFSVQLYSALNPLVFHLIAENQDGGQNASKSSSTAECTSFLFHLIF